MKPLLPIIILLLTGCVATSKHVKEGDFLLMELANETSKNPNLLAKVKQHAETPAFPGPPSTGGIPLDGLGAVGGVLAMGFGMWKSHQRQQAVALAKKVADLNPEEAKSELINSKVKV